MANQNDHFRKGFDEGTKIKLYILQKYLQEWLPVFLSKKDKYWKEIFLYDMFAGEGKDAEGIIGSPLIMLNELVPYCRTIFSEKLKVSILFNEFENKRFAYLKQNIENRIKNCTNSDFCPDKDKCVLNIEFENREFKNLFSSKFPKLKKTDKLPRFMFLDQFGIKEITEDIFKKLVSLKRTDFIFFISSSFANRFAEQPEFKTYLNLSRQSFDTTKPHHCHRVIFDYYKQLIPQGMEYYLAPFSIKKGSNIYGLIFGTHNPLGIEKFLNICWSINRNTGDANYDIDNENINPQEPSLFPDHDIPNKLQIFKKELKAGIINNSIITNTDAYRFTFEMGCLPKHANEVFYELRKQTTISNKFRIRSSNVHKLEPQKLK